MCHRQWKLKWNVNIHFYSVIVQNVKRIWFCLIAKPKTLFLPRFSVCKPNRICRKFTKLLCKMNMGLTHFFPNRSSRCLCQILSFFLLCISTCVSVVGAFAWVDIIRVFFQQFNRVCVWFVGMRVRSCHIVTKRRFNRIISFWKS